MKLYTTTTSERASKVQGGNEFIVSQFSVEHENIGEVELELLEDGEWLLKYRANDLMDWDILRQGSIDILKTKSQKVKSQICRHCGKIHKTALCN